jgi:glyoxylase-like metal-dependent hydrolase (beta-lactamase superfamily II)
VDNGELIRLAPTTGTLFLSSNEQATYPTFFDPATSTLTYVVHDTKTGVVIDPVLDYDSKSGRTSFKSAETVAKYISENNLAIPNVIDTHAHADHWTAMPFFTAPRSARLRNNGCLCHGAPGLHQPAGGNRV